MRVSSPCRKSLAVFPASLMVSELARGRPGSLTWLVLTVPTFPVPSLNCPSEPADLDNWSICCCNRRQSKP